MRIHQLAALTSVVALLACGGGGGGGITVPTPTTGSVRGTVTDNTNTNVSGANVALSASGQTTRNTTTAANGTYTFANVPVGTYTVTVTPPTGFSLGTGGGTASVTVVANQQAVVNAFVLNRNVTPAPNLVNVSMVNTTFSPQQVEVAVGGTVRWTNNDNINHNATGTGFNTTGDMTPGQSVSRAVGAAGTINYACTIHPGMTGSIIVR